MTTYKKDSFNLYIIFYQGRQRDRSFVIDSFISWRFSDTLSNHLRDVSDEYTLSLNPCLLLKIDTTTNGKKPNFDIWEDFKSKELTKYCVTKNLYFLDSDELKRKIRSYFNSRQISYISVWGDWEEIVQVKGNESTR